MSSVDAISDVRPFGHVPNAQRSAAMAVLLALTLSRTVNVEWRGSVSAASYGRKAGAPFRLNDHAPSGPMLRPEYSTRIIPRSGDPSGCVAIGKTAPRRV